LQITQSMLAKILPQTYPFLMVDEVTDIKIGESLVAVKNITANEWIFENQYFQIDHLPESFLIEAAAQAALILYHISKIGDLTKRPQYILGTVKSELSCKVRIGDQISLMAFANKMLYGGGFSEIIISNNGEEVGKVEIFYSVKRDG
jgi:3-hydroxyacyl-[acyl-carrier-protein] dehydratase